MTDPIVLLLVGIGVVIGAILWLRLHAFLALALAALIVGFLTPKFNRLANGLEMTGLHPAGNATESGQVVEIPVPQKKKKHLRVGLHLVAKRLEGKVTSVGELKVIEIGKESRAGQKNKTSVFRKE